MKLYRTRTREEYNFLMLRLENEGCKWNSGELPSENDQWGELEDDTAIRVNEKKKMTYEFSRYYEEKYPNEPIIEVSDLMEQDSLVTKIEERNHKSNAIEPEHYNKGEVDLFEAAYRTRPFNEFRAIMEFVAERYLKRDKDNRLEDLNKAMYSLTRLKEYEEKERERNG